MKYDHLSIESKWAQKWVEDKTFTLDLDKAKNPYYALFMFPYPSAEGLHIGNFYAFTCVDVMAKYKKLKGYDVFEPFGFDAFGMHSENYALKINQKPREMLNRTENNFRKQLVEAGIGCDWTREVNTTHPEYYKWTQWIFVQLFKKKLAFKKKSLLNWCPDCKTVLADEQIEDGVCERCKALPEKKEMEQWFFKITDYAQKLLDELDEIDWSEITKSAQKNWINRSEGAEVDFIINDEKVPVFTTRPDTLFGATYFVLSPEHSLAKRIAQDNPEVAEYLKKSGNKSDLERMEAKEKTGVFTNLYALNPVNNEKIPVWIADYVLMNYGTGAIMAVPAHDERDFQFALKHKIEIKEVVKGKDISQEVFLGNGEHINSGFLNGLMNNQASEKMIEWLEKEKKGRKKINYKLRDWCISRQRYWGPPIPIIYCPDCGLVVEESLPVLLPNLEKNWQPAGDGRGPLALVPEFVSAVCPKCGKTGQRETDVMDNFLDSAWYFFRYISPRNEKEIFDLKTVKKWLPVDIYIGGNEHAVLHLMYTRFITMFFHDLGLIDFTNPFKKFRANGMILKDGKKMSKSKGNVVNPEEYGRRIGYDALKTYLLFLGPLSDDKSFSDRGVLGTRRWIDRVFQLQDKVQENYSDSEEVVFKINQTIHDLEEDFEQQKYNTAVARLMELTNVFVSQKKISQLLWLKFLPLIACFVPALAEELWLKSGKKESIFSSLNWPEKESLIKKEVDLVVQINGKVRDSFSVSVNLSQEEIEKMALDREKIKNHLQDKKIVKIISVKDKLINIVI